MIRVLLLGPVGLVFVIVLLGVGYNLVVIQGFDTQTPPEHHGNTQWQLYPSQPGQPLVVGFGGGEGGNSWAGPHGAKQRKMLHEHGYSFLAVGYFGMDGIPQNLDRISLDAVHNTLQAVAQSPEVAAPCVIVKGASRGAELALLLASHFSGYEAAVGIVPGSAVFPALTAAMTTPGFSLHGRSLDFVPVPWSATPALLTGDLRGAFEAMMEDEAAMMNAAIPVEQANGPLLLISATHDEQWPSMQMSEQMMQRLQKQGFPHHYQHVALEGGHSEHHDHFDLVIEFLDQHVKSRPNCMLEV